ncbi:hypothetical protein ACIBCO_12955 [Streptomyces violascens]|uniref:hypothetical protein n=1 Tax=Streptomyces violascens TaxID=67381 RepID=UPI0037BE0CC2
MSYFMTDLSGTSVEEPDEAMMRTILDGLADADDEHPDVSLTHENGWSLSAFPSGELLWLLWENLDDPDAAPRQVSGVSKDEVLRLFGLLATGDTAEIDRLAGS